jgi:hypothetical protein
MTFRFIHNKDGVSLYDSNLDIGVVLTLEEFKVYLPEYELPLNMVERNYSKYNAGITQHYFTNSEGQIFYQDNWEAGEYVQTLLSKTKEDKLNKQNKTLDLIKTQIQQRQEFNSDFTPLGIKVLTELNNEKLLQLIINKGDVRSFIGVLVYTVLIPDESLAIDYLKQTIQSNFNQEEIAKLIKVISELIK